MEKITIGIMLGKAVKLAFGKTDTHSCLSSWNKEFIVEVAKESGYDSATANKVLELNMAGRLPEIFPFTQEEPFFQSLLKYCYSNSKSIINKQELEVYLIDKNGGFINYIK